MPARPGRLPRTAADVRFRAFLEADWLRWLEQAPDVATSVGHPGFNDRWVDDSRRGIEARDRHLREALRQLGRHRPSALSSPERLNHRLYRWLLEMAVAGRAFGDDPLPFHFGFPRNLWMPVNQMDGIHLTVGQLLPIQPRRSAEDYEAIVSRLNALPTWTEQTIALLEDGRGQGYLPPRVAIRGVPDQVRELVPEEPSASALWQPFAEFPASLSGSERTRLVAEARRAYSEAARPALLQLHSYLTGTYLPAARESVSASDLPSGPAGYAHHVRWTTTTDLTPQQIHEIGLSEIQRAQAEIEALVRSTGFAGPLPEFHRFVRTDPRFRPTAAAPLLEAYRALAKRIDPELARHFGRLPRLPYGVEPIPDYQAPSVPAAYYIPGAPRDGRPGVFYTNTYDLAARPTWRMEALTLHEAVPGHHLQIALASELEDVPTFRRFSGETAFVEGWGLYAESLGEELGLYKDPYAKFGALEFDVWRSIRLVVDTGLHALGWSRDRAIEFFREHTGMSDLDIAVEVDRYLVMPGQALAYKIGQLKIRELRTLAEKALGPRFDERAFHDLVLEEGGLPLRELEDRVRAWLKTASGRPGPGRRHSRTDRRVRPSRRGSALKPQRR
jgi:uncharacterized protein (DUF885 family)